MLTSSEVEAKLLEKFTLDGTVAVGVTGGQLEVDEGHLWFTNSAKGERIELGRVSTFTLWSIIKQFQLLPLDEIALIDLQPKDDPAAPLDEVLANQAYQQLEPGQPDKLLDDVSASYDELAPGE